MFKVVMLGILLFVTFLLLGKIIKTYKIHKEEKAKEERRKAFKKKMMELEIR